MSDTVLKIIPVDPDFVPAESRQRDAAVALTEAFPEGHDAKAETYEQVAFIDNGANTEAVICQVLSPPTAGCGRERRPLLPDLR